MTSIKFRKSLCLSACIAISLACTNVATAGDAQAAVAPASVGALEEIVVTAQRRSENLQDVPISVTAFTAELLQNRNATSTADLMKIVPGVQFGSANLQRNELTIRGIGSNRFDVGGEASSGMFLDDLYQPRFSNLLLDLLDVERVEILKGPQGTLYGRNTIGGAIAIYTPTPGQDLHINARADIGSKNLFGGLASVSGPLSDTMSGSISLGHRSRDGFMEDITNGINNGTETGGGRVRLVYKPTDTLRVTLSASAFSTQQNAVLFNPLSPSIFLARPGLVNTDTDPYSGAYSYPSGEQVRTGSTGARVDYSNSDVTLTSITGFQYTRDHVVDDQDSTNYDAFGYEGLSHSRSVSQEFRISSEPGGAMSAGGRLKWVGGLYYFRERADESFRFKLGPDDLFVFLAQVGGVTVPGGSIYNTVGKDITTDSYAVFGQATYSLTNQLNVTVGARYTRDEKNFDATGDTNLPGFPLVTSNFLVHAGKSWGKFTPKLAIDFKPTANVMIYGSYAQGYKSGVPQSASFNPLVAQRIINPETVNTFELGLKSDLLNRRLRVNVAAYSSDFKDLQVRRIASLDGGAPQPVLDNAAGSTIKGLEIETALQVSSALRLDLSYNYLDAHYGAFVPQPGVDYSNNMLPRAPRNTLALGARYEAVLPNESRITFDLLTYVTSMQFFQPDNLLVASQGGYATTDLSVGLVFPDRRLQATAWSKNVFDKQFRTYSENLGASTREVWGDRRTFGVTISYRL